MQNKYVGDVGDFGKFGLLRRLCGLTDEATPAPDLSLGVVWCMQPDDESNDGRHISYSTDTAKNRRLYQVCDADLWDALAHLIETNQRFVRSLQNSRLLPESTVYFDSRLNYQRQASRPRRIAIYKQWISDALAATQNVDVVYLDPDTGLAPENKMFRKDGTKYTYVSHLNRFWQRGQTLVIYQQLPQGKTAETWFPEIAALLRKGLHQAEPIAFRFRKGTSRAFFVVPQPDHCKRIESRIHRMLATPWQQHCELA